MVDAVIITMNSSLEKLHSEWRKDAEVDEFNLDRASLDIPKLHSKYLYLLDLAKETLREQEYLYAILLKKRLSWYDGELTKEEMDELEWEYDPYAGKLVKTKLQKDHYLKSDEVLLKAQQELDATKQKIDSIKEMLDNIKWRGNFIKNAIEFRKFQAGA